MGLKSSSLKHFATYPSGFISLSGTGVSPHLYLPGGTPTFLQLGDSLKGNKKDKPEYTPVPL